MTTISVNVVCGRCLKSPMTYLSFIAIVIGLLVTFTTVAIGYYMVYRSDELFGICFISGHPGIKRACVLDLTGGVMSILISALFIMIECVSAYLNKSDWKLAFSVSKILLSFVTVVVLLAGAIQGGVSYIDYCDEHSDDDNYVNSYKEKVCDFSSTGKYNGDVDFVAVVALSVVGAFLWIFMFGIEIIRACIMCSTYDPHEYQLLPTEMDMMRPAENYNNDEL